MYVQLDDYTLYDVTFFKQMTKIHECMQHYRGTANITVFTLCFCNIQRQFWLEPSNIAMCGYPNIKVYI